MNHARTTEPSLATCWQRRGRDESRPYQEGNIMTTRASLNGTSAAETEFEAAHYSNPETEEEWEMHEGSHYSNPYSNPELEEEWEMHEGSHYSNPYSNPEMEEEWETHEGNPYSNPEMAGEWEMHEGSHYSNPYSNPFSNPELEEEWEAHEGNPYSNPETEEEWEMHEASPYSNPEMAGEWEMHEGNHYSNPYSNPELEDEVGHLMALIARAAKAVVPQAKSMAMRVGSDLLRQIGQASSQPTQSHRSQQIAEVIQRLRRLFAQAESETAAHEAHLFGANEYETEVAAHELAHEASLTEVMAAEASHTESESEAQALLGATIPLSIRVMGGKIGIQRITPTLVRVNAQLVLNLHRRGRPGRQLIRAVPAIQRRTLATLKAIQQTGRPITPALARQVMAGQAARVLGTPGICGQALVRNMAIRNRTVAPPQAGMSPRPRVNS